ncbi:unnamed protein product [Caenorhabditis angaria]|uniref:Uncharacterized protein n=1 Tax=Caenorhabditis angaria TaxID=860376 RepID=A0A9P1N2B7_9PELO|nr:unnamed protein product [Caenorhabditis angaria]
MARAVFQDKEIYLLDDPLSAVDIHVGRKLFEKVIGPNGLLGRKNTTRILVTHNLQYTKHVDLIYVVEDGKIVESGKFEDLAYLPNGAFGKLWAEADNSSLEDEEEPEELEEPGIRPEAKPEIRNESKIHIEKNAEIVKNTEKVELGRVKKSVYLTYFRIMGWFPACGFLAFFIAHFLVMIGRSLWLSDWSNENSRIQKSQQNLSIFAENPPLSVETRLIVYASFGGFEILLLIFTFTCLTIGSLRASYGLHAPLIHSLLRAPITFFDLTPIGRIINRLSRDLDVIDRLQDSLRMMTQSILNVFMILFLISYSTPIFLIGAAPLIGIYYVVMTHFIPTSRQLKRLESVNRSPILSTISESIHGSSSIRAFNKISTTSDQLSKQIDKYAQCRYLSYLSNRWLGTRLELVGNTVVLFASLSATLSTKYFGLSPGLAGLSVSYALTITEVLNICVRTASDLESNVVSVERIDEYQKIEPEAPWKSENSDSLKNWPETGAISFKNYSMKYRPTLPKVLDSINLDFKGGEKIGIIGRTGSGKSSLTMSIYRLIEKFEGSIEIDGKNIENIGLHDLRKNIIIIPQEPVVFSGTLRFNLDPFNVFSDQKIWECLEICQLSEFATADELKLMRFISEGGKNMSQGERQLVCLARAILRGAKIVILDEATASVDSLTDSIVQQAVRNYFPDSTKISIAHRLDTIADSDRIVVLDQGHVAEFDTPQNLLKNPASLYSQLINEKNRT